MVQRELRIPFFIFTIVGCILFLILIVIGMFLYKGGTKFDPSSVGYSFFENYLSDLGRVKTYDGTLNTIPRALFTIALSFGGVGLAVFYLVLPYLFIENKTNWKICLAGSILGAFASTFCVLVAYIPSDLNILVHRICVLIFGCISLPANLLLGVSILKKENYPNAYGWIFISFCFVLTAYIILWIVFKFDSPYNQEVAKIVGQKIVIFFEIIVITIQANGARLYILNSKKRSANHVNKLS